MNVNSKWIEDWLLNFASSNFQVIEKSFTSIEHNLDVIRCSDWIIISDRKGVTGVARFW